MVAAALLLAVLVWPARAALIGVAWRGGRDSIARHAPPALALPPKLQDELAPFLMKVDLGVGGGIVEGELTPLFSSSLLITVRYPLPFRLEADPIDGCVSVVKPHAGLLTGDVLRAFSTLELRYDSTKGATIFAGGYRGAQSNSWSSSTEPLAASTDRETPFWEGLRQRLTALRPRSATFGPSRVGLDVINPEIIPNKVLFLADGKPYEQVADALLANAVDRTDQIVMVFERPLESPLIDREKERKAAEARLRENGAPGGAGVLVDMIANSKDGATGKAQRTQQSGKGGGKRRRKTSSR